MIRRSVAQRNEMMEKNYGLVVDVAKHFRGLADHEDLVQEGMFGLAHACERFDPSRGLKFSSYAWRCIMGFMARYVDRTAPIATTPINLSMKARRALWEASQEGERIAHADIDPGLSAAIMARGTKMEILERERYREDMRVRTNGVVLLSESFEGGSMTTIDTRRRLSGLTKVERYVVVHRFGLFGNGAQTLKVVGKALGVSRERVRQIQNVAMCKMRGDCITGAPAKKRRERGRERQGPARALAG